MTLSARASTLGGTLISKMRNPNIEIRNKTEKAQDQNLKSQTFRFEFSAFRSFEFVSSFEFRNSSFVFEPGLPIIGLLDLL
jgi:hypothetical protein